MSRVITFSTKFPSYHPRKGEPTFFVEKLNKGLNPIEYGFVFGDEAKKSLNGNFDFEVYKKSEPKYHTIRAGNRWKVGDKFSPRIWGNDINPKNGKSGPYNSKQIIIAPDIELKKVWNFEMKPKLFADECEFLINDKPMAARDMTECSKNDGLEVIDFVYWFAGSDIMSSKRKPFSGQIICWNENIEYN